MLIADGWPYKHCRRKIGISAGFIESKQKKNIFLGLYDIPEVQHSAISIIFNNAYEMEFFLSICTNSAPIMSATVQFLGLKWDSCFIHVVNNCIKKYMEETELICSIQKKQIFFRKKEE